MCTQHAFFGAVGPCVGSGPAVARSTGPNSAFRTAQRCWKSAVSGLRILATKVRTGGSLTNPVDRDASGRGRADNPRVASTHCQPPADIRGFGLAPAGRKGTRQEYLVHSFCMKQVPCDSFISLSALHAQTWTCCQAFVAQDAPIGQLIVLPNKSLHRNDGQPLASHRPVRVAGSLGLWLLLHPQVALCKAVSHWERYEFDGMSLVASSLV